MKPGRQTDLEPPPAHAGPTESGEPPAIELCDLHKSFGEVQALQGIDLTVNQGEVFGFLGPNGAGKSTVIRILFDLIRPSSGRAAIFGLDAQSQGVAARGLTGYVPGELHLYENRTGKQLVELFSSIRGGGPDPRYFNQICSRLDVDLGRKVGALSKGNKQKIGLLLAMMHQPRVLVMDEPTSGLDPLVQEEIADLLDDHASKGNTVFFSSHVLSEVERMCHRVAFIRAGNLVAVEDVSELRGRSLHILEVTFAGDAPADLWSIDGVKRLRGEGHTVRLEVQAGLNEVLQVLAQHPVVDLRTEQPSLEDIFLAYYQEDEAPELHETRV
jgi:ABC-2 type transport system ATP-binding protein